MKMMMKKIKKKKKKNYWENMMEIMKIIFASLFNINFLL